MSKYGPFEKGKKPNIRFNLYHQPGKDGTSASSRKKEYTVKVTELSKVTTEETLAEEFGKVTSTANVLSVRINKGRNPSNWGYVNYSCQSDAQAAVQLYNGNKTIDGNKIKVKMRESLPHSKTPYDRPSSSSGHSQTSSSHYLQNPQLTSSSTCFESTPDCNTIKVTMQHGSLSVHELEKVFEEFETSKKTCIPMILKETPNFAYINFWRKKDALNAHKMNGREFKDVQLHVTLCTKRESSTERMVNTQSHKQDMRMVNCDSALLAKLILSRIDRFRKQLYCCTQSSVFSITVKPMKSGNRLLLTGNPEQLEVMEEFIQGLHLKLSAKLKEEYFPLQCQSIPLFSKQEIAMTLDPIEEQFSVEFHVATSDGKKPIKTFMSSVSEMFSKDKTPKISSLPKHFSTPDVRTTEDLWSWQTDDGTFMQFSSDACAKFNEQYKLCPGSSFSCDINTVVGTFTYTINFSNMTQKNETSQKIRSIRRQPGVVEWHYENEDGIFVPFSLQGSEKIETLKTKDSTEPSFTVVDGTVSVFDFSKMRRIDDKTKKECAIYRKVTPNQNDGLRTRFRIHGLPEDIPEAAKCLKDALDKAINSTEISLSSPSEKSEEINAALLKISRQYFVSAEIVNNKLRLEGVEGYVEKVQIKIMEEQQTLEKQKISERRAAEINELPEYWEPQTKEVVVVKPVSPGSVEWNQVVSCVHQSTRSGTIFTPTVPTDIIKIERIQNQWLWGRYSFSKQRMSEKNGGIVNEKDLFHGTGRTPPEKVYKSRQGFDFRFASINGMWGTGTYFAVNANYSKTTYAYQNGATKQIILAKVLTGETYRCPPDSSLKKPPLKKQKAASISPFSHRSRVSRVFDTAKLRLARWTGASPSASSTDGDFEDELYDSVSGNTGNSDIFVIYDHEKAYPAYLITFRN